MKKWTKEELRSGETGTYGPVGDVDPDQLTFEEAFGSARDAGMKSFIWKGKKYTTKLAKKSKKKGGRLDYRGGGIIQYD